VWAGFMRQGLCAKGLCAKVYAPGLCARRDWYFEQTAVLKYQCRLEDVKKSISRQSEN
jgi:hypothetical protein